MNRPVAYSSNARRTSGARSGSGVRLLPAARGAFRKPIGARNTHRPSYPRAFRRGHRGHEQPSGPASGQDRPKIRGVAHAPAPSVTPPKLLRARRRTPRWFFGLPARKQSAWRDSRQVRSRTPVHRLLVSTANLALPKCANHRSLSRPPSRRQPFRSESRHQCEKSVEKSIKFFAGCASNSLWLPAD